MCVECSAQCIANRAENEVIILHWLPLSLSGAVIHGGSGEDKTGRHIWAGQRGPEYHVKSALCLWTEEVPRKPVLEKPLGGVWGGKGVDTGVRIWSTCGMQH